MKIPTIDIIEEMQKNLEKNPTPRKLGSMYCFWYKGGRPRIVVGPDYMFSITEVVVANLLALLVGVAPSIYRGFDIMVIAGVTLLIC